MQPTSPIARLAAVLALVLTPLGPQALAEGKDDPKPMELRLIMRELGKNMQIVTDGISREDWELIAKTAPKIADHRQPPMTEKIRILAYVGTDAGRFRGYDGETHEAAKAMEAAARRGDGQAVIASFATVQTKCLACHQAFRKPFVEHFYGQR